VQRRRDSDIVRSGASPGRLEDREHAEGSGDRPADPLSDQEKALLTLLFNKYRGALYRYLSGLVRPADDVAELVQETYFRIMRHTETVRFETVARSYLFQTATNLAREYYRRRSRRHWDQHVGIEEAEVLPSEVAPEQDVLWEQAVARLKVQIKEMPRDLQEVLIRHRFQHETYPEIAKALGISTRTVERRLSDAVEFLAHALRGVL
jgi:RNA polymerase sigma factor (sigma-70 family)